MHVSVRNAFAQFSKQFEGYVHWMYLDVKGLITIGIGNLIDPEVSALDLPFVDKQTGKAASKAEISHEWRTVKGRQDLKNVNYKRFDGLTRLRLADAAITDLVLKRLHSNEAFLKRTFDAWDTWPANAQLGVLSVAWAVGAGFAPTWPKFTAACHAQDWLGAAENCKLRTVNNPGVAPRNDANVRLFTNASTIAAQKRDLARLYFPDAVLPAAQTPSSDPGSVA